MSDDDINSIIASAQASLGTPAPTQPIPQAVWEPIDEATQEVIDSIRPQQIEEYRDLDAEEDADWDGVTPLDEETPFTPEQSISPEEQAAATEEFANLLREQIAQPEEQIPDEEEEEEEEVPFPEAETTQQTETQQPSLSQTVFTKDTTQRFSGADWYETAQSRVIILAGLGGIGSWYAMLLARIHPKAMFIYDADTVESVNLSGQLYGMNNVGQYKADATSINVENFADYHDIFANRSFFTEESEPADIMICGFDSMRARKLFYKKWKNHVEEVPEEDRKYCLFIDARMSAESIQVICLTGNTPFYMDQYEADWLFDDNEADATVCSYKQTSFCAAMIGAIMNNLFVNFCTNLSNPVIARSLPFITTYEADTMYFKTVS